MYQLSREIELVAEARFFFKVGKEERHQETRDKSTWIHEINSKKKEVYIRTEREI